MPGRKLADRLTAGMGGGREPLEPAHLDLSSYFTICWVCDFGQLTSLSVPPFLICKVGRVTQRRAVLRTERVTAGTVLSTAPGTQGCSINTNLRESRSSTSGTSWTASHVQPLTRRPGKCSGSTSEDTVFNLSPQMRGREEERGGRSRGMN